LKSRLDINLRHTPLLKNSALPKVETSPFNINGPIIRSSSTNAFQQTESSAMENNRNIVKICLQAAGLTRSRKISEAKLILESIGVKDPKVPGSKIFY